MRDGRPVAERKIVMKDGVLYKNEQG